MVIIIQLWLMLSLALEGRRALCSRVFIAPGVPYPQSVSRYSRRAVPHSLRNKIKSVGEGEMKFRNRLPRTSTLGFENQREIYGVKILRVHCQLEIVHWSRNSRQKKKKKKKKCDFRELNENERTRRGRVTFRVAFKRERVVSGRCCFESKLSTVSRYAKG
ncbi:hypothetical protein PUN28_018790 [Cardiocondyla obscurior]|uniref:Secreted protein n=1 Tax=Cardiocondyla obscurior TaxID=286306 RepID=A0AAW2EDA7_9HYME